MTNFVVVVWDIKQTISKIVRVSERDPIFIPPEFSKCLPDEKGFLFHSQLSLIVILCELVFQSPLLWRLENSIRLANQRLVYQNPCPFVCLFIRRKCANVVGYEAILCLHRLIDITCCI